VGVAYRPAPEVEREIRLLVDSDVHPQLVGIPISACFRSKAKAKRSKIVLATAQLVTGRSAYLAAAMHDGADFYLIEVAEDEWETLSAEQRRALVDHELTHCAGVDPETRKLAIRGHDLEEFVCIVERHGAWTQDVATFAKSCQQLTLADWSVKAS